MGASAAYHLAEVSKGSVTLVEKEPFFGQGATGRCAGGVRHQFATEVNVKLSIESLQMLDQFPDEIGHDPNYRKCGYLFVLTEPKDVANFKTNVLMQRKLGVRTEWLSGDEVQKLLPTMCFEDALAGTVNYDDGLADPNSVVMGYLNRAREMGARLFPNTKVTGISVKTSHVIAVETHQGVIETPIIINTAGPWASKIGKMVGIEIPITPLRRQIVTTTPLQSLQVDFPFVIDFAQSLYFHREGEGILTGMSNPDEVPDFDQSVDVNWETAAIEAAIRRMPILEQASRLSDWAGLYEMTPDAHPIIGVSPLDGFYILAGFSGHGFMHGPIAGKIISEIIVEGQPRTVDVSMLDLARFSEGRTIQEYNII